MERPPQRERQIPLQNIYRHTETGELIDILSPDYLRDDEALTPGVYEHYKTTEEEPKHYLVHGVVRHRYTGVQMVIYKPMYETEDNFPSARPLDMFLEDVEHEGRVMPRFRYCGPEQVADTPVV